MDTLLFCYANNQENPLATLNEEYKSIDRLLDFRSSKGQFQKECDTSVTTDSIAEKILTYKDSLCLFHYSGHAGSNVLVLEDTLARAQGIAQLLAGCPNLRLVFLNGCSTLSQIKLLTDQNIKAAVIATATPVEDRTATDFSINFYQVLANQYSLKDALDYAQKRLQVKVATAIQPITRSMFSTTGESSLGEVSVNQWYIYYPDEETENWELPTGVATEALTYVPNKNLRGSLYITLSQYDPILKKQFEEIKNELPDVRRGWLSQEILRRLPYPLSEPLRRLFCPNLDGQLTQPAADLERLKTYVSLFDSAVDLLMSILLSQIRDWLQNNTQQQPANGIDDPVKSILQNVITNGWSNWKLNDVNGNNDFVANFRALHTFINQHPIPFSIPELNGWLDNFSKDVSLLDSLQFLFSLKDRLAKSNTSGSILSLCQIGEDHLSNWLKSAGFWANYRLDSFRNIRAVRFYNQAPTYQHERVDLRTNLSIIPVGTHFQEIPLANIWDCQSVLLVKVNRQETAENYREELIPDGFLNLAPFIIDQNVYTKSDQNEIDVYSFHPGDQGEVQYKSIKYPNNPPLNIDSKEVQKDFSVLTEQVKLFRKLLGLSDDIPTPSPVNNDNVNSNAFV